jgi:flagellar biosynthesis/type III secretory pathway ATPase
VGAYVKGTNPSIDESIEKIGDIRDVLSQTVEDRAPIEETLAREERIAAL